ncbi:MAG: XRE family transcriptional regulator [Candidatus Thiodiazotropha taylori]
MTSDKKTPFHKKAKEKGWDLQDIAKRWGISIRQISRVANSPKQKDLDAVSGLPVPTRKQE